MAAGQPGQAGPHPRPWTLSQTLIGIVLLVGGYYGLKHCLCGADPRGRSCDSWTRCPPGFICVRQGYKSEGSCQPEGEATRKSEPAPSPEPTPKAGLFPKAPAKRDLEAFALYHRLQGKAAGTDPAKIVARRLNLTEAEANAAFTRVAEYENEVSTWFDRRIREGEQNPYGSLISVEYVHRLSLLQVTFRSGAQAATNSARSVVKYCLTAGALVAWRAVYDKAVAAPVRTVSIRVQQRDHLKKEFFIAASANLKREVWDALITSGRFAVAEEKAELLSPRYSPWMAQEGD